MLATLAALQESIPGWLVVLLLSASPILELRGAIPLGIIGYQMNVWHVLGLAILGNLAAIPLALGAVARLEAACRRWPRVAAFTDAIHARARRRAGGSVRSLREAALVLIVALPVPGAGAWTAAVVAHLYEMPRRHTYLMLALGIVMSALLATVLTLTGHDAVDAAAALLQDRS